MALMADAGDEALMLIRYFDDEEADASLITERLQEFLDRIAYLLIEEKVWSV